MSRSPDEYFQRAKAFEAKARSASDKLAAVSYENLARGYRDLASFVAATRKPKVAKKAAAAAAEKALQ